MKFINSRLFTWGKILLFTVVFSGIIILMQRTVKHACPNWIAFDCPYYYPISVFNLRLPGLEHLAIAGILVIVSFFSVRYIESKKFNLTPVILFGAMLIAGSTLIQGISVGFYAPIAGDARTGTLIPYTSDGQEYYHDALGVTDPVDFFRRYNEIQPTLHQHSHTHPPGAVLTLYVLEKLFRDPALIALVIMLFATITTVFFFHRLMLTEVSGETARYMAFLLVLLPAIQIYYLATLDALITALLTGTIYLFCFGAGRRASVGAICMLTASFLLSFASLFILPVLVGFDLIVRRSLKRSFIIIGGLLTAHILFYLLGYNAVQSFRTASLFENPDGFMLFADPVNYLFTRVEDVAEITLFFGPFLLVLLLRGLKDFRFSPLNVLTVLGCATLLGMYLTGAWRTGETARACAFIYPYLLFPVGRYLEDINAGADERLQLAFLVFSQSIVMQTFGRFHW